MDARSYSVEEFETIPDHLKYRIANTQKWVVIPSDRSAGHIPIIRNPGTTDYPPKV